MILEYRSEYLAILKAAVKKNLLSHLYLLSSILLLILNI